MKKALSFILILLIVLSLTGCGSKSKLARAIDDGDWISAVQIFNDGDHDKLQTVVIQKLQEAFDTGDCENVSMICTWFYQDVPDMNKVCIDSISSAYDNMAAGSTSIEDFEKMLQSVLLNISTDTYSDYKQKVTNISESKKAFSDAKLAEESGQMNKAYGLYAKVIEEDTENYSTAKERIDYLSLNMPTYTVGDTVSSDRFNSTFIDCFSLKNSDYPEKLIEYCVFEITNNTNSDQYLDLKTDFSFYADDVISTDDYNDYHTVNGYESFGEYGQTIPAGKKALGYVDIIIPKDTSLLEIEVDGVTFEYDLAIQALKNK